MITGPDGEMVMNPIPGEAGTDYPVFTEGITSQNRPTKKHSCPPVPETGFNCAQQQFLPGIYTDTAADCQVSLELLPSIFSFSLESLPSIWSDDLFAAFLHVRGERSLHSLPLP